MATETAPSHETPTSDHEVFISSSCLPLILIKLFIPSSTAYLLDQTYILHGILSLFPILLLFRLVVRISSFDVSVRSM
ncbi:hypothetical protein IMY05_013G0001000 [Salix suchowensis]|nr:hypothetical protein IMY05_013G0001000 [Salix suchowensis]